MCGMLFSAAGERRYDAAFVIENVVSEKVQKYDYLFPDSSFISSHRVQVLWKNYPLHQSSSSRENIEWHLLTSEVESE